MQFLQLVKTASALPDVGQEHSQLRIAGMSRESREQIPGRATDSRSIREIPVNELSECFHPFFFFVHDSLSAKTEFRTIPPFQQNPTISDLCRGNVRSARWQQF
jgi:hypothetical protein